MANELSLDELNTMTVGDLPSVAPTFPAGDYTGVLRNVRAFRSAKKGELMVYVDLIITEGEYTGKRAQAFYMLEGEQGYQAKKGLFRPLGIADDTALGAALAEVEGTTVAAKVIIKAGQDGDEENKVSKIYGQAS